MKIKEEKRLEDLTKKLVNINSVNNGLNKGETKVATFIKNYLLKLDYFKNHKDQVFTFDSEDNRHSLIAYIKGKGNNTIILMGHIDTVDIKDYGKASKYACNPDKLPNELKKYFDLPNNVLKDIKSNKYMFGRGALDMKAGTANNIMILEYFSKHLNELNGNLVLLAECDEEGDSKGVISALDKLIELKKKENFDYKLCINTDYSVSYDNNRYVYLGTVGKLLPSFVCVGKECHVGSPFEGFDPNLLLSILNTKLSLNKDLTDKVKGKTNVPPICLKQADTKDSYTVQTALSAYSYFNYMIYTSSPKEVINKVLKLANDSFKDTLDLLNKNYKKYCKDNGLKVNNLPFKKRVYTFNEYDSYLKDINSDYSKDIKAYSKKLVKDNPNIDIREYSYKIVLKAYEYDKVKEPVLIVYFGSTFYSNVVSNNNKLIDSVNKAVSKVNKKSKYDIQVSDFYPYISDMSYMACIHKEKEIKDMLNNCPYYEYRYDYPYEKIKEINVPVVNMGTFGFDGHTYIERLEKKYTFNELPNLIYETIVNFLNK